VNAALSDSALVMSSHATNGECLFVCAKVLLKKNNFNKAAIVTVVCSYHLTRSFGSPFEIMFGSQGLLGVGGGL
jgi:hypothetical protein